jgi:hypothetical protein
LSDWIVENALEARILGTGILVVIAIGFFALWWRRHAVWRLVFALGFLVIGILNALGSISILGGFAAWFQFQGI